MSYFMTTYMCRHCTSHFKRAMCISCRPCVDVHKGGGGGFVPCGRMWTGRGGQKRDFFVDVINGWPLAIFSCFESVTIVTFCQSYPSHRVEQYNTSNKRIF